MSLTDHLTAVITTLRRIIAWHAAPRVPLQAITPLFWNRCTRILRLFASLERRFLAGESLAPRVPAAPRAARAAAARPRVRHPAARGWLLREIQPTAQVLPHFQALLARPETAALLRAAPQAGRLLRPICAMFGLALPDILALPRPARPKPARPAPPQPRSRRPRLKLWRGPTIPPDLTRARKPA